MSEQRVEKNFKIDLRLFYKAIIVAKIGLNEDIKCLLGQNAGHELILPVTINDLNNMVRTSSSMLFKNEEGVSSSIPPSSSKLLRVCLSDSSTVYVTTSNYVYEMIPAPPR